MAVYSGPNIITDGLVLSLDKYNEESYQGEPSTNLVYYTGLDAGWAKDYNTNIVWNDIDPPDGIDSPVVGFNDVGYPSSQNGSGYWYSYGDYCPQGQSIQYSISLYVKTNVTSNVSVNSYTADNTEAGDGVSRYWSNSLTVTASDGWKRLEWNFTSASAAQSDSLSFHWLGMTGKLWLCAPQMEANPHATKYIKSNDNGTTTTRSATDGWRDLSGNNNHADLTSLTYSATKVPGTLVNDFSFNGSSNGNEITVPSSSSVELTSELTAEVWMNWESGAGRLFQKDSYSNSANRLWEMGIYDSKFRMEMWPSNGIGTTQSSPNTLTANIWYHLLMTFDGINIKMYENSALVKTISFSGDIRSTSRDITIGGSWGPSEYHDGLISSVKLYNRALSAAEVLQNYNAHKGRYGL